MQKKNYILWFNAFPELEDQDLPAVCLKAARHHIAFLAN